MIIMLPCIPKFFSTSSVFVDVHISLKFSDRECNQQTMNKTKNVRIAYRPPSTTILNRVGIEEIEQILGPMDAMQLYFPQTSEGCHNTQKILNAMQRGLVISMTSDGDLYVERLCRARVFYGSSPYSTTTADNNNNNNQPTSIPRSKKTLIFSFRNEFLPALQAFDQGLQPMPSCCIYFSFGLPWGLDRGFRETLVNMTVTHSLGQYLREVRLHQSPSSFLVLSAADELDEIMNQLQVTTGLNSHL